jgi:RimJ/RimL family protein N-acetyltransferase
MESSSAGVVVISARGSARIMKKLAQGIADLVEANGKRNHLGVVLSAGVWRGGGGNWVRRKTARVDEPFSLCEVFLLGWCALPAPVSTNRPGLSDLSWIDIILQQWSTNRMSTDDFIKFGEGLLQSERLRFRIPAEEEYELLHTWWLDPTVMMLQSVGAALLKDRDSIVEMFRAWSRNTENGFGYAIALKETNQLIGHVALWGITVKDQCANLGIILNPQLWGQGYGKESLILVLRYSFQELNLHRIQLEVLADNTRAIRCYSNAGFRQEGLRRQVYFRGGKWRDQILMAVLAEDFRSGL